MSPDTEQNEVARVSGKWREAGVPHKGWTCSGYEDLGEPCVICEMCESTEIRYVHYMEHPNYPPPLRCGCICAGHMEENYTDALTREKTLKNAASRRKNWVKRKWRTSAKGNSFIKTDGYVITVFKKLGHWSAVVKHESSGNSQFANRLYTSENEAKLMAFDLMLFLKNKSS